MTDIDINFVRAVAKNDLASVKKYLADGANVNVELFNQTALSFATSHPYSELMEFLIKNGADINLQDEDGNTALMYAMQANRLTNAQFLIHNGAKVNLQNKDGKMAFDFVCENSSLKLMELLINAFSSEYIDANGNTIPMIMLLLCKNIQKVNTNIYKLMNYLCDNILTICQKKDSQGNQIININHKNFDGMSLIDLLENIYVSTNLVPVKGLIRYLANEFRFLGSAEPKKSIMDDIFYDKLDIVKLDDSESNKINVLKILKFLYNKYPLSNEEINKEIQDFKDINPEDYPSIDFKVTDWNSDQPILTINDVVTTLSHETNVHDRLTEAWDFKKVLATIIHIIRITDGGPTNENLLHCLSSLKMCNLGKLINLVSIVQDIAIQHDIDYSVKSYESFSPVLQTFAKTIKDNNLEKQFIDWYMDIKSDKSPPDKWSANTSFIQGMLNKIFFEYIEDEGTNPVFESYHFKEGLNISIIQPLLNKLLINSKDSVTTIFHNIIADGENIILTQFFQTLLNMTTEEEIELAIDSATYKKELLFGDFKNANIEIIKFYYNKLSFINPSLALKFIKCLSEHLDISQDSNEYISNILNESNDELDITGAVNIYDIYDYEDII